MGKTTDSSEPLTRKQAKKVSKRKKLEALLQISALNERDNQLQASNSNADQLIMEKINTESKRTLEGPCDSNSHKMAEITGAHGSSNDGPCPKRLKPDPIDSHDEEMPLHCDVPPTPPSAPSESSKYSPVFPPSYQVLPHALLHETSLLSHQNLPLQNPRQFLHFMNGAGSLQFLPALLIPDFVNIPGTCLSPMAISVLPSIYSIGNPVLLPNPNVRIPVFAHLTPPPNEDPRPAENINDIDEDLKKLRKSVRARTKILTRVPNFTLSAIGESASLRTRDEDRIPIFPSDLQRIILRASMRTNGHVEMRCGNFKSVSTVSGIKLLILEGLSLKDVQSCPGLSAVLGDLFPVQMECIMPTAYEGALLEELAAVPLSPADRNHLIQKYGSLEVALRRSNQIFRVLRAFFPITNTFGSSKSHSDLKGADEITCQDARNQGIAADKFPRTQLLLSAWQMIEEGYPLPLRGNTFKEFVNFSLTKTEYKEVSSSSPMYGLDCEMCLTTTKKHELTRVSIINEEHRVIYDTLVKPPNPIINYLTEYSGITQKMMEGVTTTLRDVQRKLQEILEPDAILVGQSLNSDLVALQLMHPYVIDTSVIFNLSGERCRKSKLKYLAKAFLQLDIQHDSAVGHNPTEDASTALKLVQLKLAEGLEFGDAVLSKLRSETISAPEKLEPDTAAEKGVADEGRNAEANENKTGDDNIAVSVFRYLNRHIVNIVGNPDIIDEYHKYTYTIDKWGYQDSKRERLYRPHLVRGYDDIDIVDKAVRCMNQSFCTIAHVQLQQAVPELLRMGDEEIIQRLKAIASDFKRAAPALSVVLVVLGGNSEGANGAVYMAVRQRSSTAQLGLTARPTLA